jgi:hypothetical protein
MTDRWEPAFVAIAAIVGEPLEATLEALGDEGAAHAADLLQALRSTSKDARARALARVVSEVAIAVDAMGYA